MERKTLGIIGKGNLVQNFWNFLTERTGNAAGDNATAKTDEAITDGAITKLKRRFCREIGTVKFYNYGYNSEAAFKKSGNFDKIDSCIKQLGFDLNIEDKWEDFFVQSDLILDASAGHRPQSLVNYATKLAEKKIAPEKKRELERELTDLKKDYQSYADQQRKEEGKKQKTEEEFKKDWDYSLKLIQAISEINDQYPTGMRVLDEFPFHLKIVLERSRKIKQLVEKGYQKLPTYINMVNEPCLTSNCLAGICPEITPFLVAGVGFDLGRLERILNQEYQPQKRKAGLNKVLRISLTGFHDRKVMVPIIYPEDKKDEDGFARFFELLDANQVYLFLREELGRFWDKYQRNKEIIQRDINQNLLQTIVAAAESRGCALSLYPSLKERRLYNGFYHPIIDGGKGVFLIGAHRFRNGRVFSDGS